MSRRRDELVMYHVAKVTEDLYVLRVDDRYTKYFEALWEIPEGITYNAYLLKTDEGDVLFDAWKRQFSSHLMEALERVTSPDRLKYVVVHHMEPDHTGSLEDVLRWAPNAKVLGHPLAGRMMNAYPKAKERFKPVKDGEVLEVGGKKLRFVHTPWLHWPETMMTWLEEEGVLLTCDAFGGYGIPLSLFDDQCVKLEEMIREMRKYVVTVIGHYREWIDRNIAKLEKLGIKPNVVAPAHGLIWRKNVDRVFQVYKDVGKSKPKENKVLLVYASMYGTVEKVARGVECELVREGMEVAVYGFNDTSRPYISEILTDASDAEVVVFATPTYEVEAFPFLKFVAQELCWKVGNGKKAVLISSYGWSSAAIEDLKKTLENCGYKSVAEVKYNAIGPTAITDEAVAEIAKKVVDAIKSS
ncbi:FprA family A-type flavoprotein [Ignicoccus hospitalis]|uniref:Beta-lactamase domain protein n=1 Tax=Ignicoccus hospitalis (strain KIN4/I / DSM 18386 / JCM 14125) TaxID=453591 RepID=A8ABR1_IGNH4|nr:FprA family A-type flavoprotein [Ignicoccus hospitalis]ABU82363.1 beta-lactamase domain protein [Ignicoccus hospitalis KIN4/I]HIH90835.1 FprA family A-type flavoprotein [Desulfurococcaceae archaeon]